MMSPGMTALLQKYTEESRSSVTPPLFGDNSAAQLLEGGRGVTPGVWVGVGVGGCRVDVQFEVWYRWVWAWKECNGEHGPLESIRHCLHVGDLKGCPSSLPRTGSEIDVLKVGKVLQRLRSMELGGWGCIKKSPSHTAVESVGPNRV